MDSDKSQDTDRKKTPRTARGRHNKIYRTPPTPPPEELLVKEKSFILDSPAVSRISLDYSRTNPKLGPVIPPFNSQRDSHSANYFSYHNVNRTLHRTGQGKPGTSLEGPVADRFQEQGAGVYYLRLRNQFGAGHSRETIDGHSQFMTGLKPIVGYNGRYGYRRNNPWLRQMPSPFGTASTSPTH